MRFEPSSISPSAAISPSRGSGLVRQILGHALVREGVRTIFLRWAEGRGGYVLLYKLIRSPRGRFIHAQLRSIHVIRHGRSLSTRCSKWHGGGDTEDAVGGDGKSLRIAINNLGSCSHSFPPAQRELEDAHGHSCEMRPAIEFLDPEVAVARISSTHLEDREAQADAE